jgi:hypothetical protein
VRPWEIGAHLDRIDTIDPTIGAIIIGKANAREKGLLAHEIRPLWNMRGPWQGGHRAMVPALQLASAARLRSCMEHRTRR